MIDTLRNTVICGDSLDVLKTFPDDCIDAIVTDPPAGISFMGKEWDSDKGGRDKWIAWMAEIAKECHRVIKPGGHALVWAMPRTSHWTGMAWENGGFEPREKLVHAFGSGFPKSHNLGVAVSKINGEVREVTGVSPHGACNKPNGNSFDDDNYEWKRHFNLTKGTSAWEGFGTALKPAYEDWWLFRKPISESTIAHNCLKWGTGGINIDESRVESNEETRRAKGGWQDNGYVGGEYDNEKYDAFKSRENTGRFPSNIYHDGSDEVLACFPDTGGDSGSAARFFQSCPVCIEDIQGASLMYHAKASKAERNLGCGGLEFTRSADRQKDDGVGGDNPRNRSNTLKQNTHATVKPYSLMQRLVGLISRKGQIVLDPFCGSGTSCMAAKRLGRDYIGIDLIAEHVQIAECRVAAVKLEEETLFPEAQ